jgi:hypothetical protein
MEFGSGAKMSGSLAVRVKRGGPWWRRLCLFLFVDIWR